MRNLTLRTPRERREEQHLRTLTSLAATRSTPGLHLYAPLIAKYLSKQHPLPLSLCSCLPVCNMTFFYGRPSHNANGF